MSSSSLFDIASPKGFLIDIVISYRKYQKSRVKLTRDLMYIVMGLNHLNEWIAPGYRPGKSSPKSVEEAFSESVRQSPEHRIIRAICNASKHYTGKIDTSVEYGASIDEWPEVDSVQNFDKGPPTAHFVNDTPVENFIESLIELYEAHLGKIPE